MAAVPTLAALLALVGCADDEAAQAPATTATTVSDAPVCRDLAQVGAAWGLAATEEQLGDPEALAALADDQIAGIRTGVDGALASGEVPPEVATDLTAVAAAGEAYLLEAVAWANGDDPGAVPTLVPGTTDAQRRIDVWAAERCGAEVWP